MRILLINDESAQIGGAERYFSELTARLQSKVEVFTLTFGPENLQTAQTLCIKQARFRPFKLVWRLVMHPFIYWKMKRFIKRIRPDVIHLHNCKQFTATVLKVIAPYRVVQTLHDYSLVCPLAQNIHQDGTPCQSGLTKSCFWAHRVKYNALLYRLLTFSFLRMQKSIRKQMRLFFAGSPLLVTHLEKCHFTPVKLLPPFILQQSTYDFAQINPNQFLYVGKLDTHKGIKELILEFALAFQQNNQLTLLVVGDGPARSSLKMLIKRLQLSKQIKLLGWQKHLALFYQHSAALIFPSIGLESFGLVITDAMSYARPVIATNRGAAPWIIEDKQTGLLYDPLIKGDLAHKILMLAGQLPLIRGMGERGYCRLEVLFDNDRTLDEMVRDYNSIL